MIHKDINVYVAVISHKRPENVIKIQELVGDCTFFVNKGEKKVYTEAGARKVIECGSNICQARNKAVQEAGKNYCIQVSDDLKKINRASMVKGKPVFKQITFHQAVYELLFEVKSHGARFGGVAVSSNRLNYKGTNVSLNKLVVNDLICLSPKTLFDEDHYLKEDYSLTISELLAGRPVVRMENILCEFPHRQNKGGANSYRNDDTESKATSRLIKTYGKYIRMNPKRKGQILLNYSLIRKSKVVNGYTLT